MLAHWPNSTFLQKAWPSLCLLLNKGQKCNEQLTREIFQMLALQKFLIAQAEYQVVIAGL